MSFCNEVYFCIIFVNIFFAMMLSFCSHTTGISPRETEDFKINDGSMYNQCLSHWPSFYLAKINYFSTGHIVNVCIHIHLWVDCNPSIRQTYFPRTFTVKSPPSHRPRYIEQINVGSVLNVKWTISKLNRVRHLNSALSRVILLNRREINIC